MPLQTPGASTLDHFFSSSAARLDRWRELNAKAQAWAAEARSGKRGGGRAAVEAALAEVRALEDFFAYPGLRLMKSLAERIAATTPLGVGRLVRRHQRRAAVGQLSLRRQRMGDGGRATSANVPDRLPFDARWRRRAGPISKRCSSPRRRPPTCEDRPGDPPPAARRRPDDLRAGAGRQLRGRASLATIMNGKIEAVVIYDGIPSRRSTTCRCCATSSAQLSRSSIRRASRRARSA